MSNHVSSGQSRPWYEHITIDLLARVLNNSIFQPFIAWLALLCQSAVGASSTSFRFRATLNYACLLSLFSFLKLLDELYAYGRPRKLDWDEEVVVITGGARGLGKILAEVYGMRGASVAVLDVQKPSKESEGLAGVEVYECDVGDAEAVEKVKLQIETDLGIPTILINNAGIVYGKPLLSLGSHEVEKSFKVNTLAHFNTIRTFLPTMLASKTGGTIVTVASVLGKLGASHLSDYTATKAALIAMHSSLRAELNSPSTAPEGAANIRTVLVTPGQLSTNLFQGVKTPSSFLGPVVETVELAREIVKMVDSGMSGEISLPLYARWIDWLHVLPPGLGKLVRGLSGMDRAMEGFGAAQSKISKMAGGVKVQ
ncbi:hypothetical protein LTR78_006880 [Recurvomyces mirabilis]|uniref:NAD(P)-binding protein n=1 Tax=Recurvomyces mirabilis TaxID=574656 RepID=A0AAE0WKD7_9PEZI|nr:hypothetical protein LTR78_006880 [Recurvomyces mirabilis]KAK5153130.1 hypothetical protein LTS14_007774 [Recurvomyces mirabilis]